MPEITRPIDEQVVMWLESFSQDVQSEILAKAANRVGLRVMELVGDTYPPDPPNQAQWRGKMLKTDKQVRWWWAMMHKLANNEPVPDSLRGWRAAYKKVRGRKTIVISGHYKRTGTLIRSVGFRVDEDRYGVSVTVGPGMATQLDQRDVEAYSRYVLDLEPPQGEQAAIHQNRWTPLYTMLELNQDELFGIYFEELRGEIDRRNREIFGDRDTF